MKIDIDAYFIYNLQLKRVEIVSFFSYQLQKNVRDSLSSYLKVFESLKINFMDIDIDVMRYIFNAK